MATPQFQLLGAPISMTPFSPGSVRLLTKTPAGVAIDVSSGYTLNSYAVNPASDNNSKMSPQQLKTSVTATFDTTGVTLSWTGTQADTMAGGLATLHSNYIVTLSNDGGSSAALLSTGQLTILNPGEIF